MTMTDETVVSMQPKRPPVTCDCTARAARPTREKVITVIMREAECSLQAATHLYIFLEMAVRKCRMKSSRNTFHLREHELRQLHPLLRLIMPGYARAEPGSRSAHDLINRHFTDPERGEIGLIHSMDPEIQACRVQLILVTAS